MEKPIRILQVLGIVGGGGVEAVILEYYKHINRDKVQFDFIVHDDNKIDITEQIDAMGGRDYNFYILGMFIFNINYILLS